MTALVANAAPVKVELPVGYRLTVVAATGGAGSIVREADAGLGVTYASTAIATGETKRFGPFYTPVRFTVSATGASLDYSIAPASTDHAPGVTDASSAAAGDIGEVISATLAQGSAVALTTATAKTVTSISLTPGDWDVDGVVGLIPAASTSITQMAEGAHTTTDTLGAAGTFSNIIQAATVPGANAMYRNIPRQRINVAATTTVYLIAQATFTVSTLGAFGTIRARRVR